MSRFERGLALVSVGDQEGMIDQDGKWVVPAEHTRVVQISNDRFFATELPCDGTRKSWFSLILNTYTCGERWGVVARGGAWIVRPKFAQVSVFSDDLDGLFWAWLASSVGQIDVQWRQFDVFHGPQIMPQVQARATRDTLTRGARLGFRLDEDTKNLIERAAQLSRRKVSDFCVTALVDTARQTIAEHETLVLSEQDRKAFFATLIHPPKPSKRLQSALAEHGRRVASGA